jgi:hypothetical protein
MAHPSHFGGSDWSSSKSRGGIIYLPLGGIVLSSLGVCFKFRHCKIVIHIIVGRSIVVPSIYTVQSQMKQPSAEAASGKNSEYVSCS